MRIKISHETTFTYSPSARWIIQNLRLTPRSFDSQYVMRWRVSVDLDGALRHNEDALGNIVHTFSYQSDARKIAVLAQGEVETTDAVGVVRGSVETLPADMFLRASALAQPTHALREFAAAAAAGASDPLERLHAAMGAIYKEMTFDPAASHAQGTAAAAFALKKGAAADFAHIFIACAQFYEIPARFISGYAFSERPEAQSDLFAWAEAYTPGLGWIAFDPVHDLCANDQYVRVAMGFDAMSAAPFRISHSGGEAQSSSTLRLEQAQGQSQN
jgi:transglutaminase-like putative cysteine protease